MRVWLNTGSSGFLQETIKVRVACSGACAQARAWAYAWQARAQAYACQARAWARACQANAWASALAEKQLFFPKQKNLDSIFLLLFLC